MKGEIIPIFKSGYYRSNFSSQSARMLCRENLAMIYSLLFSSSWDMCRVEEPMEQDNKISFGLFPFEVQISDLSLEPREHFTTVKQLQNGSLEQA